jgi:hypothetical protein
MQNLVNPYTGSAKYNPVKNWGIINLKKSSMRIFHCKGEQRILAETKKILFLDRKRDEFIETEYMFHVRRGYNGRGYNKVKGDGWSVIEAENLIWQEFDIPKKDFWYIGRHQSSDKPQNDKTSISLHDCFYYIDCQYYDFPSHSGEFWRRQRLFKYRNNPPPWLSKGRYY